MVVTWLCSISSTTTILPYLSDALAMENTAVMQRERFKQYIQDDVERMYACFEPKWIAKVEFAHTLHKCVKRTGMHLASAPRLSML